ncbi:hypothetical protein C2E23DRAFT_687555, partial [Lenzites betulinus]
STSSASTTRPTFFGLFDRAVTPELDIEAQLPQPIPARTHAARSNASVDETTSNVIDDFFGASRRAGTRDSRHDDARAATPADVEAAPPSYEMSLEPPAYSAVSDQPTLAMYLFKFGFLFPLFWIAGAFILLSPLQAPEDWETTKPEYERAEMIASMRRAEVKWAKRCLYALGLTTLVVTAIVVLAVFTMRS